MNVFFLMRTHAWAGGVRPGRQSSLWQCAQYLRQLGLPLPDSGVSGKDKDKDRPAVAVEAEGRCRCTAATQCTRARGLTLRGRWAHWGATVNARWTALAILFVGLSGVSVCTRTWTERKSEARGGGARAEIWAGQGCA